MRATSKPPSPPRERAFPAGRRCPTASARAGWRSSPTRSKRASKTSPTPNRATAASRIALARDVEIPRAISNLRFFAARRHAVRQRIAPRPGRAELHAAPAARRGRRRSRPGTCRCTCSPGRSRRRSPPATPWSPSRRRSRRDRDDARRTGRARSASRRACSTSCTASAPKSASRWCAHPRVKAISFTGSTAVGKRIADAAPRRCSRRCRWNWAARTRRWSSPTATGERHLDTIVRSAFQNSGQICLCGSRILVERRIYAEFRDALRRARARLARRRSDRRRTTSSARWCRRRTSTRSSPPSRARATKAATCCCGGNALRAPGLVRRADRDRRPRPGLREQPRGDLRPGGDAASLRRRRRSAGTAPTPATTAWPLACGRATSTARTASPRDCASAWSGSTPG